MKERDPVVYLLIGITVVVVGAVGLVGFLRWKIDGMEKDLRRAKGFLGEMGEVCASVDNLLEEAEKDDKRRASGLTTYIYNEAGKGGIRDAQRSLKVTPGRKEDNVSGGYRDNPYTVKIPRNAAQRRSAIINFLRNVEGNSHGVKVTRLKLSPENPREPTDKWAVDITITQRDPIGS